MKYLFITEIVPLSPLLDFDINDINIDLHNDFECTDIKNTDKAVEFFFKRVVNNTFYNEQNGVLIFSDVVETNIDFIFGKDQIGDIQTITNFARGELSDKSRYYQDKDIKYFFIDFLNGSLINIFCKEAAIFLW